MKARLYIPLRIAYLMKALRVAAIVMTTLYSAFLFKMIVFKYPTGMVFDVASGNYIPFKTILTYLSGYPMWTVALNNLVGNLVPFILLGLLLPFTTKQPLKGVGIVGLSFAIGTVMEITQAMLQMGVFDIDDILLNALGVAIGYILLIAFTRYFKKASYQCPECGFHYRDDSTSFNSIQDKSLTTGKEWAEKCEAWCTEHKSCNLEIIALAVENETGPQKD